MAKKKISELPVANPMHGGELFPIVQDGTTKQVVASNLVGYVADLVGPEIIVDHVLDPNPHPVYALTVDVPALAPVQSVAGKTGAVTLTIGDTTGLQTALDGKFNNTGGQVTGDLLLLPTVGATRKIEIGTGRTDDFGSWIDMGGDSTYIDYGLRIARNSGANGGVSFLSRGTGAVVFNNSEGASYEFRQQGAARAVVDADGLFSVNRNGTDPGGIAGNNIDLASISGGSGNTVSLKVRLHRRVDGTDWTTEDLELRRRTDAVDQGFIRIGGVDGNAIYFGEGTTVRHTLTNINATFSGNVNANNYVVNASAAQNAHLFLRDETGLNQGVLYWDRAADNITLRRYNAGGTVAEGELKLEATAIKYNNVALASTASPVFTGTPTAPTAALGTNNTQLATTAFVQSNKSGAVSSVITTTYTLQLSDANKFINASNASPITITIPPQSSVAWEDNTQIEFVQGGAGAVTIAAGAGVTLRRNSTLSAASGGQWSVFGLKRIASDEWVVFGQMGAA